MNLTPKQLTILKLIRDSRVRHGYSPTMQELADQLNVSKVTVFEHVEALIKKGALLRDVNTTFALRVDGESMRDEGILDGDYVIIERRETARNGDRVVALLPNGETTLKTYYREDDHVRLQPANPSFDPILVKEVKIQGIVAGVLRRY
jgi:SOS-response transcriptional repressor LexA